MKYMLSKFHEAGLVFENIIAKKTFPKSFRIGSSLVEKYVIYFAYIQIGECKGGVTFQRWGV